MWRGRISLGWLFVTYQIEYEIEFPNVFYSSRLTSRYRVTHMNEVPKLYYVVLYPIFVYLAATTEYTVNVKSE